MGLFGKKKKKNQGGGKPTAGKGSQPSRSKHKYHSRGKKRNLIQSMKISGSVPTTIIDAIHGDKSIISSDQDFVKAQRVNLNGKIYYPVFVMDEDTFEKCGIDSSQNRKVYGQLSNGLKTSSGATGLLPIVTPESSKDSYFAILPMNDAFEFLNSKPVFADYTDGWPVGLLNIDNDELSLQKTSLRLTMSQWLSFVKGDLNFTVDHGQLKVSQDVPDTSDPLALNGAEVGTDEASAENAPASSNPLDEFDEPDSKTSTPSNPTQVKGNSAQSNGYGLDDMPIDDSPKPQPQPSQVKPTNNNTVNQNNQQRVNNQPQPPRQNVQQNRPRQQAVNQGQQQARVNQNRQVNQRPRQVPNNNQATNAMNTTRSQDELAADNVTLQASVKTLNDLHISISDQEFVDAYMRSLKITPLPMADESKDSTGRIHHINELRKVANQELQSSEVTVKAHLRQWFETQRSAVLDALKEGVRDDGSLIKRHRQKLTTLQQQLNDTDGLTDIAKSKLVAKFNKLDKDFNVARDNAKQQALVEVDAEYNQKQVQLDNQKDELLQQQIGDLRQQRSRQITDVKTQIQQIAQTAASQGYMKIMKHGAVEYERGQRALDHLHTKLLHKLDDYEKQSREDENRRVSNQADIVRNDTTITALREQINKSNTDHQEKLTQQQQNFNRQLEEFKSKSEEDKAAELRKMHQEVSDAQKQRDESNQRLTAQQKTYEDLLKKHDSDNLVKVKQLRDQSNDDRVKTDQSLKRMRNMTILIVILAFLFGALISFFIGSSSAYKNINNQRNMQNPTPVYQYAPQYSQNNNQSSSSSSSSSSSQSSSSSSHHSSDKSSSDKSSSSDHK